MLTREGCTGVGGPVLRAAFFSFPIEQEELGVGTRPFFARRPTTCADRVRPPLSAIFPSQAPPLSSNGGYRDGRLIPGQLHHFRAQMLDAARCVEHNADL